MSESSPLLETFVDRLRHARQARGFSARGLSLAAGLSQAHVGMIERGDSEAPTAETVTKIAKVLGVNLQWLLVGDGEMDLPGAGEAPPDDGNGSEAA